MVNDLGVLKCFYCGQTYRLEEYDQKKGMICLGCGMQMIPLVARKIRERDTKGLCVLLGYFAIVALLGSMGGIMLVHGWSFWVTFAMIGGIIYFVARIFMDKFKISEVDEYLSATIIQKDRDMPHVSVFEGLVADAIGELPQKLKDRLANVAIVIESRPKNHVSRKLRLMPNRILLGLFQGIPLNKKSVWQSGTMPERITIFQDNIEAICHSDQEIKHKIKEVVRHEVAHFVGFTEEEITKLGY